MPAAFTQPAAGEHPPPVILVGKVLFGGKNELTKKKKMPYEVYLSFYVGISLRAPKKIIGCYLKDNNHNPISLLPIV